MSYPGRIINFTMIYKSPDMEERDKALKNMTVPVGYCFGTQDPVFQDYYESNIYGIMNTRGSQTYGFLEYHKIPKYLYIRHL